MSVLSKEQIDQFRQEGFLTMPDAVSPDQLAAIRADFAGWVEDSRAHTESYGKAPDGRPRFDLENGHSAQKPALRRVSAPGDVSPACLDAIRNSRMTDMVADLIGPDVKHHHNKINSKLPGAATEEKWHQDFPFTPHTNSDIVTALLMVDEVTDANGPLEVAPGSHTDKIHPIWHDGVFTGAVDEKTAGEMKANAMRCTGPAGSVCLMHTKLAHGSAPNLSDKPRTLLITVYSAADAMPLTPNPVPNHHEGMIVRGEDKGMIRTEAYSVAIPQYPKGASFFTQQKDSS